jgi:hypothetical protein
VFLCLFAGDLQINYIFSFSKYLLQMEHKKANTKGTVFCVLMASAIICVM